MQTVSTNRFALGKQVAFDLPAIRFAHWVRS